LAAAICSIVALPAAEFTTYIGNASDHRVAGVVADAAGNTFIAGSRVYAEGAFPYSGTFSEVFVTKLDSTGKTVLFTILSGKGSDTANALAVDAAGNIYVAGSTSSANLPLHNPLQSTAGPGFLAKYSPDASQLIFSTYFPAAISALAVDRSGNVYVCGTTNSPTFPVTAGLPASSVVPIAPMIVISGAFLTKISPTGDHILYSTVIAGHTPSCVRAGCFVRAANTTGVAVAVDPAGNAYFAGTTGTSDLPTTAGAFLQKGTGAYVGKVNAAGTALSYLTLIGATNYDNPDIPLPATLASALVVDDTGNAYLTGATADSKLPSTAGAYQTIYAGDIDPSKTYFELPPTDVFVAKINSSGSGLVWATYIGGKSADAANSIALDPSGNVWITGTTGSPEFPNQQGWMKGGDFVLGLNSAGSSLVYSAQYPSRTVSQSVAVDPTGTVHVAGPTGLVSTVTPKGTPLMRVFGIANAAFGPVLGRIAPFEVVSIYGPHIGPASPATFAPDGSGYVPTSLAGVQVLIDGRATPLLYVSDSQINAVAPGRGFSSDSVRVRIVSNGVTSPDFVAAAISADPQVFQNSDGTAAAVNQDGSINSAASPAKVGSVVSIWATGVGLADQSPLDGRIAPFAYPFFCCQAGGDPGSIILYDGAAPGMVAGVVQINVQLGLNGTIEISVGSKFSSPVNIHFKP
jgi:uncharacterized protein (TIGR03437 family)